eukprot:5287789-Amphidinium_carterae.1
MQQSAKVSAPQSPLPVCFGPTDQNFCSEKPQTLTNPTPIPQVSLRKWAKSKVVLIGHTASRLIMASLLMVTGIVNQSIENRCAKTQAVRSFCVRGLLDF